VAAAAFRQQLLAMTAMLATRTTRYSASVPQRVPSVAGVPLPDQTHAVESTEYDAVEMKQPLDAAVYHRGINQSIKLFLVRLKVDQRAGQLSLPHSEITKTEKIELKHKTDEQIIPVNGLEP